MANSGLTWTPSPVVSSGVTVVRIMKGAVVLVLIVTPVPTETWAAAGIAITTIAMMAMAIDKILFCI